MITINAKVSVNGERKIELELPPTLPTGEYEAVIVLNEISKVDEKEGKALSKNQVVQALEQFAKVPGHWKNDAQEYINQLREYDRY
jgi:hypothetical protein